MSVSHNLTSIANYCFLPGPYPHPKGKVNATTEPTENAHMSDMSTRMVQCRGFVCRDSAAALFEGAEPGIELEGMLAATMAQHKRFKSDG